ncbi:MAG TPA: hypothetical protein VLX09_25610 [Stellaceae bacterium]|nr:hypothetical protein [Stellaceae bacterium]
MTRGVIILLCIVGGLVVVSVTSLVVGLGTGNLKLSNVIPPGAASTPEFRAKLVESSRKSCLKNAASLMPGANGRQADVYCDCFSKGVADSLTEDNLRYMMDHLGSMPPDVTPKLKSLTSQCRSAALAKS